MWPRNLLFDPLMWSGSIEVLDIGIENTVEPLLMQDEQMIETFTSYTQEKAFTDGIGSRGVIRRFEHLDSTRSRNTGEVHPKLAIVIPKKVFRPLPIGRGFSQRYALPRHR
jgi:hypothetical protein